MKEKQVWRDIDQKQGRSDCSRGKYLKLSLGAECRVANLPVPVLPVVHFRYSQKNTRTKSSGFRQSGDSGALSHIIGAPLLSTVSGECDRGLNAGFLFVWKPMTLFNENYFSNFIFSFFFLYGFLNSYLTI